MGELWIPEAEDLTAAGTSGVMEGGEPKATWHVTVSPSALSPGGTPYFDVMHRVLTSKRAEPHCLYDPMTDRLGQYFALNRSARALANDGTRRTNGSGLVNIQVEVVAMADDFTRYWKPGPNFRALMRAIRSWGVPDAWPGGHPIGQPTRAWSTYVQGGHFGHVHVPGNDHVDPQVRNGDLLFAAAPTAPEEVGLSSTEVNEIKDYVRALLVDGYTVAGKEYPGVAAVNIENQRRISQQGAQLAALSTAVAELATAKGADADAITKAVVDKINSLDFHLGTA